MTNYSRFLRVSFLPFASLLLVFAISSCKPSEKATQTAKAPATTSPKGKKQLTEEELINLKFLFVNATKERALGNDDKAAELFAQCIRIDGGNHASMYELARIYAEKRKLSDALFFARSARQLDPQNEWYRIFLGNLYMSAKKGPEAESEFSSLYKDHPRNLDYAFKYASALLFNGKIQEAIKVYDKVEDEIGVSADLSVEKERLWLRLGKVDKAAEEIEKLIASDPKNIKHYSLLVELYQVNNMPEKAYESIQRMQGVDAGSPYVMLALAEYYRSTNQKEKSFEQLKLAFGNKDLETDLKIKIITSYMPLVEGSPEMMEQATTLSQIFAETNPEDAMALAIYADFLTMNQKYEEAAKKYEASLLINNKTFVVWQQLLICQSQLSDFPAMLRTSTEALTLFPDQSIVYLFNGISLSQSDRHEEAVSILNAGSKLVVDNDFQLIQFYSNLADNYNTLKKYEESDANFEKALKIDPRDPLILNNYAYYLSVRKVNLDKAESMSKLSNEIRPDQASYEDTYGWILFEMGKYNDALIWLQKALDHGGSANGTILEHMGDVLFKLNRNTEALDYWKRAKEAGDTSDKIDQKIKDQKFYE